MNLPNDVINVVKAESKGHWSDISATSEHILSQLNEYWDNLLLSEFSPRAANGQKMRAIGKMYIHFKLAGSEHEEDVYISPHLSGAIIS